MSGCKFGAALSHCDELIKERVAALISEDAGPTAIGRELPVYVYRGVIRAHLNKLCKCYTVEDLVKPGEESTAEKRPKVVIPKGWEPRVEYDDAGGYFVTPPQARQETEPEDQELFAQFPDMDPERWQIKSVRRSSWQAASGEWMDSYKAEFIPRTAVQLNIDELLEVLDRPRQPVGPVRIAHVGSAFVVASGDHQTGKTDTNGGSVELVERFVETTAQARERMQRFGTFDTVVLAHLGDHVEGHVSQNGRLIATQDLATPEQVRLFRRLLMHQVTEFADLTPELIIALVDGNHDAAQRIQAVAGANGWAVEAAAAVADALAFKGGYDHVKFVLPGRGEETVTLDVANTRMGLVHGHQWRGGPAGVEKWFQGQSLGRLPIGDSDVLLTGHYHHLRMQEVGAGQTTIQVPSMDGGSKWFRDATGADSPAGLISFIVSDGRWSELELHRN